MWVALASTGSPPMRRVPTPGMCEVLTFGDGQQRQRGKIYGIVALAISCSDMLRMAREMRILLMGIGSNNTQQLFAMKE